MDREILFNDLKVALSDEWLSPEDIYSGLNRACSEHSRYFPRMTKTGTMTVIKNSNVGDSHIDVIGSYPTLNSSCLVDEGGIGEFQVTVSSVEELELNESVPRGYRLLLTDPLTSTVKPGKLVVELDAQGVPSPVLKMKANRSRHLLPTDFISEDTASFMAETGQKIGRTIIHFYDGAYVYSSFLSPTNLGHGAEYLGAGYANPTFSMPNNLFFEGSVRTSNSSESVRVDNTGERCYLITPRSTSADSFMSFYYKACHIPETVPLKDRDLFFMLAKSIILNALADKIAQNPSYGEGGISENPASHVNVLRSQAQLEEEKYNKLVRNRPYVISG